MGQPRRLVQPFLEIISPSEENLNPRRLGLAVTPLASLYGCSLLWGQYTPLSLGDSSLSKRSDVPINPWWLRFLMEFLNKKRYLCEVGLFTAGPGQPICTLFDNTPPWSRQRFRAGRGRSFISILPLIPS